MAEAAIAQSPRKLERARREGRAFARETRRLLRKQGRRLPQPIKDELEKAADEVDAAAEAGDRERLGAALKRLDALHAEHLRFARKSVVREYLEAVLIAVVIALVLRGFALEAFQIPSGSMVPTLLVGDHIFVNKLAYGLRVPFTFTKVLDFGAPRRGDVVVFVDPREPDGKARDFIKRVVGLPGDVVELRDQVLYVNGVPQPRVADGDLTYEEQNEVTGKWWSDTCVKYVEQLARGPVDRPKSEVAADVEEAWRAAAAQGVERHEVLQCRRSRLGEREGPFEVVQPRHVFVMGDNRDRSADSRSEEGGWQVPFDHIKGRAIRIWWSWGKGGWSPAGDEGIRVERLFKRID